ncbi:hypothetical protein [Schwartzia succinivorans]|nr:hypothetical protein [Schwartzia succinivorans]MBQ2048153.1 hypothetical protein [Schwartzia sp. (in: firmicutes)]MBQ3863205.1 hypothetical protein [Schwartzia sp. (in: firmicutes)]
MKMGILSMPAIFAAIFIMVVLCFACLVMMIRVKGIGMRLTFLGAAMVLLVVMAVFSITEFQMQSMEKPEKKPVQEETKDKKTPSQLAHSYGSVELKIDEATIPKNEDKLRQPEKLDLETGNKSTASPQKQQEIRRVGRHLGAIEQELFDKLVKLDAQKQEISSAQASGLLDNYDSLLKISQIKLQQAKLIELAMQEKLKVLDEAVELTEDEKAKDRERVQQRMQAAQQKQQEYNQVISEITANPEVFHKL